MAYAAKILRDSLSHDQVRLTTMEVTFPRIVLAEFNTHRVFSRNSASSRAIPVEKMLARVEDDPFIPIYWGKNQKGMQAERELNEGEKLLALCEWIEARDLAVENVKRLLDIGVHKQITNRLLEPFLWHTVIVTATEWDNFWALRCNKDAQPEIKRIADMMRELYVNSKPSPAGDCDWHLPLVDDFYTLKMAGFTMAEIVKICVGRCTRVSYLTHDGTRDPKADIELCQRLLKSGHMSPFEHAARPMTREDASELAYKPLTGCAAIPLAASPKTSFCGNFRGWVQARKEITNEDNFAKVLA